MKLRVVCALAAAALLSGAAPTQREGAVCANPARPCTGFQAHDLSFVLPRGEAARAEARSQPFFAVILRSGPRCSIPEADRRAAQTRLRNKVFSQRFECDGDVENNVTYTGVAANTAFLAVYAGRTRAEAVAYLERVRATGRFPGANLRRMQVVYVYP